MTRAIVVAAVALLALCLAVAPTHATFSRYGGGGGGDGSLAINAAVAPRQIIAAGGLLYVVQANALRRILPDNTIQLVAGTYVRRPDGIPAPAGPVPALATALNSATAVAVDLTDVYVATEAFVYVVEGGGMRRIVPAGIRSGVGGMVVANDTLFISDTKNGRIVTCAVPTMGCTVAPLLTGLTSPGGLAVDATGALYFTEGAPSNRVKRYRNGAVTVLAGDGVPGSTGDGGPATAARLNQPSGIAVAPNGDVFIADTGNHRIRRIAGGIMSTVAGTGQLNLSTNWVQSTDPLAQPITSPQGVAVDAAGAVYIGSEADQRIYRLTGGGISPVATSTSTPAATATRTRTPVSTATRTQPPTPTASATTIPTCQPGQVPECRL